MLTQIYDMDRQHHFYVACSGGVDSMAVADFYRRGGKKFSLAHFNHNTAQADKMQEFVLDWGAKNNIEVVVGKLTTIKPKKDSPEEFWRKARYNWFSQLGETVVTCHHLNDVAETWLFSSLHGNPKVIPARVGYVIRSFLLNEKSKLIDWCVKHNVKWMEDLTNTDINVPRNRIRHSILPEVLKINPGLLKVLKKKYKGY